VRADSNEHRCGVDDPDEVLFLDQGGDFVEHAGDWRDVRVVLVGQVRFGEEVARLVFDGVAESFPTGFAVAP
jgi:hypothetical protein